MKILSKIVIRFLIALFLLPCLLYSKETGTGAQFRIVYIPMNFAIRDVENDGSVPYLAFPMRIVGKNVPEYKKSAEGRTALGQAFAAYFAGQKHEEGAEKFSQVILEFKMGKCQGVFWIERSSEKQWGRMNYVLFRKGETTKLVPYKYYNKVLINEIKLYFDNIRGNYNFDRFFPNLSCEPQKQYKVMISIDQIIDYWKAKPYVLYGRVPGAPIIDDSRNPEPDADGLYLFFDGEKINFNPEKPLADGDNNPIHRHLRKVYEIAGTKNWNSEFELHCGFVEMPGNKLGEKSLRAARTPRCFVKFGTRMVFFYESAGRMATSVIRLENNGFVSERHMPQLGFFWEDTLRSVPIIEAVLGEKLTPPSPDPAS